MDLARRNEFLNLIKLNINNIWNYVIIIGECQLSQKLSYYESLSSGETCDYDS